MIVIKPLSAVRIGNAISRLTVGQPVPDVVIEFWKKNKMLDDLKNAGSIGEKINIKETVTVQNENVKHENKTQNNNNQEQDKNKKVKDESLFSNEKR